MGAAAASAAAPVPLKTPSETTLELEDPRSNAAPSNVLFNVWIYVRGEIRN